jgi:hypothetical protein
LIPKTSEQTSVIWSSIEAPNEPRGECPRKDAEFFQG